MTVPNLNSCLQTAHYSTYLVVFLLLLTTSTTSHAASIRITQQPQSVSSCICTQQQTQPTTELARIQITERINIKEANSKEIPEGANAVNLQPTPVSNKFTFKLRKIIKMSDQVKNREGVAEETVAKEISPKEAEAPKTETHREDRKNMDAPHDNIVFPKDEESVTTTSEASAKTTMKVGNRILIGGLPNDGYGRDANGEIVEIFQ